MLLYPESLGAFQFRKRVVTILFDKALRSLEKLFESRIGPPVDFMTFLISLVTVMIETMRNFVPYDCTENIENRKDDKTPKSINVKKKMECPLPLPAPIDP